MSISTYIQANTTAIEFLIKELSGIPQNSYGAIAQPAFQSSIGAHYRHVIEYYQCFFAQLETNGAINYDLRQRNIRIETDVSYAQQQLRLIRSRLTGFSCDDKREVLIEDDHCDYQAYSSIGRELIFLIGHTEHHSAMIAAMLRILGYEANNHFGVANATINYQQKVTCSVEKSA